jgi:hypothetical protein
MRLGVALLLTVLLCQAAGAHSASDAYLAVTSDKSGKAAVLHGQWDIALRDLDFVLDLAEAGRGQLTWGDVRRHQRQIEDYAYRHLRFASGVANSCVVKPLRQMIDEHADGAYVVLIFDVTCATRATPIVMDYSLFFDIDPSHRAVYVGRSGADIATAVLAPRNSQIQVN